MPLSPVAGVAVHGFDLRAPLSGAAKAAIDEALLGELMAFATQDDPPKMSMATATPGGPALC
ncbi:MAG: hypothetical protein GKR94_32305 [Gammaproteobacteria bacterium]|nr:hypothetical protein [Gammaproteobacteria bacterium]